MKIKKGEYKTDNNIKKESICLFSSYFASLEIPEYVIFYLKKLQTHFDKIIFITTEKNLNSESIHFLKENSINLLQFENEGFDFGMWSKALKTIDIEKISTLGLINDSCLLVNPIDEVFSEFNSKNHQYFGLISSAEKAYHIQSYFLLLKGKSILILEKYFEKKGILNSIQKAIKHYEIGLSQEMIKHNIMPSALYDYGSQKKNYQQSFYSKTEELISEKFPLFKKKLLKIEENAELQKILKKYNLPIDSEYYKDLINKTALFNENNYKFPN